MAPENAQTEVLLNLLQLEKEARRALTPEAFHFTLVSRTRILIPYRQAILFRHEISGRLTVVAASDTGAIDRNAPFIDWLQRLGRTLLEGTDGRKQRIVEPEALNAAERQAWPEWAPAAALWCPLLAADGRLEGVLLLFRDEPWRQPERVLLEQLAETAAHAWSALLAGKKGWGWRRRSILPWLLVVSLIAPLFLPVRQSALAPAEVVARDPMVVSAPLDGVIESFHVRPNQAVNEGDPLFTLEGSDFHNAWMVARETLAVAEAKYRTAAQGAFNNARSGAELALLKAEVALRRVELDYARERVERIRVRAEWSGRAVFRDVDDWLGRPVKTGERILQLADPRHVKLRIHLPVREAIVLHPGAEVRFFMDIDPLRPLSARVIHGAYQAETAADGLLAYPVTAGFAEGTPMPRMGLRGTAKIFGDPVPLMLYLFRRPMAVMRQMWGF